MDWLSSYAGAPVSQSNKPSSVAQPATKAPVQQKGAGSPKQPWQPAFPPLAEKTAIRAQLFNNGNNPGKGRSQYTLKVRIYSSEPINQRRPDWERVIQLIDPKKVVGWAHKEYSAGNLTDEAFNRYSEAARLCSDWACDSATDWARMGNVSSKPGTIYFPDQFVSMRFLTNGEANATLHIDGLNIEFETFNSNTRGTRSHSPTHHALYDPCGLIDKRGA